MRFVVDIEAQCDHGGCGGQSRCLHHTRCLDAQAAVVRLDRSVCHRAFVQLYRPDGQCIFAIGKAIIQAPSLAEKCSVHQRPRRWDVDRRRWCAPLVSKSNDDGTSREKGKTCTFLSFSSIVNRYHPPAVTSTTGTRSTANRGTMEVLWTTVSRTVARHCF